MACGILREYRVLRAENLVLVYRSILLSCFHQRHAVAAYVLLLATKNGFTLFLNSINALSEIMTFKNQTLPFHKTTHFFFKQRS